MEKHNSNDGQTQVLPTLQAGMSYIIYLKKDGRRIFNALCHAVGSSERFFTKGNDVYPLDDVLSYSLLGHNVPDNCPDPDHSDPDRLVITDEVDEVVYVVTSPAVNPDTFRRRVKCLMISGMTQSQAEEYAVDNPMQLSLFYDIGRGGFAIDAEAVGNTPLYNPYTGREIPDETE